MQTHDRMMPLHLREQDTVFCIILLIFSLFIITKLFSKSPIRRSQRMFLTLICFATFKPMYVSELLGVKTEFVGFSWVLCCSLCTCCCIFFHLVGYVRLLEMGLWEMSKLNISGKMLPGAMIEVGHLVYVFTFTLKSEWNATVQEASSYTLFLKSFYWPFFYIWSVLTVVFQELRGF